MSLSYAGVNSRTNMEIATGKINPYINQQMAKVQAKVQQINELYKQSIAKNNLQRDTYYKQMVILDKEIVLTLQRINNADENIMNLRKDR
jgi:hypothetical protein